MKDVRILLLCLFVFNSAFAEEKELDSKDNKVGVYNPFILMPMDKKVAKALDAIHKIKLSIIRNPGNATIKKQLPRKIKTLRKNIQSANKKAGKGKRAANKAYKEVDKKLDKALDADEDIDELQEQIAEARSVVLSFAAAEYNYEAAALFAESKIGPNCPWRIKKASGITGTSASDKEKEIKPDTTKLTLVVFYNPRNKESMSVASQVASMEGKHAEFIGILVDGTEADIKKAGLPKKKVILDDRVLREKYFVRFLPQVMVVDGDTVKAVYVGKIAGLNGYLKYYINQRKK